MTNRKLIAEYIFQGIKQGDLVTLFLNADEVVSGYILDEDVFTFNPIQELKDAISGYKTGASAVRKSIITIEELKLPNEQEAQVKDAIYHHFTLIQEAKRNILVEDIIAIKKIEEEGG